MHKDYSLFFQRLSAKWNDICLISFLTLCCCNSFGETAVDTGSDTGSDNAAFQTVPFITLRDITGKKAAADYFGGERDTIHAGYCDFQSTSMNILKPVANNVPFYVPEDILTLVKVRESDPDVFWKDISKSSKGSRLTFYTHGFNIDFEKGCRRAALFSRSVKLKDRFLLFSWPSDGAFMNYVHDEADMYWSVEPLRKTLNKMLAQFGEGNINLVAHSLGARGVFLALVMIAQSEHSVKPLFNQLVFVAPDIDATIFLQYLPLIRPIVKNITIYASANDSALALSQQLHGYPRLGETGPHLDIIMGVEIINLSDIARRSPSGHLYHLYHSDVVNDLKQLLNENKPAAQRAGLRQTGMNTWMLETSAGNK